MPVVTVRARPVAGSAPRKLTLGLMTTGPVDDIGITAYSLPREIQI